MYVFSDVVALVYKDGVMIAADTRVSSVRGTVMYANHNRVVPLGKNTAVIGTGMLEAFQTICEGLLDLEESNSINGLSYELSAEEYHSRVVRIMYHHRNQMDPIFGRIIVAGFKRNGEPFLGTSDPVGTSSIDDKLATSFGHYLAVPLLHKKARTDMTEAEARSLIMECVNNIATCQKMFGQYVQITKVTKDGVICETPERVSVKFDLKAYDRETPGAVVM